MKSPTWLKLLTALYCTLSAFLVIYWLSIWLNLPSLFLPPPDVLTDVHYGPSLFTTVLAFSGSLGILAWIVFTCVLMFIRSARKGSGLPYPKTLDFVRVLGWVFLLLVISGLLFSGYALVHMDRSL